MNKLNTKVALGSDHAGFSLKKVVKQHLVSKGYEPVDYGTYSGETSDYSDFAHLVADAVENKTCSFGIVMCGSGNGVSMTANKHQGIRSALCWIPEIARLARKHNDANILALPARFIDEQTARDIVDIFCKQAFEGGRHCSRIEKISIKHSTD